MKYGFPSFKFQHMWVSHPSFLSCVDQAWGGNMLEGSALLNLMLKLKRVKAALREWNKNVFGCTEVHIDNLQNRINRLERDLQESYSEEVEIDLVASQVELSAWLEREE